MESLQTHVLSCHLQYACCLGSALTLSEWKIWARRGGSWFTLFYACFFSLSMLEPAVSIANSSGLVSARLWIEINTLDRAIKALLVRFVTTGRLRAETKRFINVKGAMRHD